MTKTILLILGGLASGLAFLFAILTLNPAAAFEGLLIAANTGLAAAELPKNSSDARKSA